MKPDKVNILGMTYKITYVDNPAEVDMFRRQSLWGQIDYWTRTIRIYDNGRTAEDIFETLIHEIIEGLKEELNIHAFENRHDDLELLSIGLADTLTRNGFVKLEGKT
ncbi:MAG: hypothetical protein PHC68_00560 [Syntrophorhabdaceae bacterium]|nr:hypothetical protein [Syntrophorhabdaceae bacterium]